MKSENTEFVKIFIKEDTKTGGNLLFKCEWILQNRLTIEAVEELVLIFKEIRASSIGKAGSQTKTSYGYKLKIGYELGVKLWSSKLFFLLHMNNMQFNNCLIWYHNLVNCSQYLVVNVKLVLARAFYSKVWIAISCYHRLTLCSTIQTLSF